MPMWIVSTVESYRVTRIVLEEERAARGIHLKLLPLVGKQYLAVSLSTAQEKPLRSDEEVARADALVRANT